MALCHWALVAAMLCGPARTQRPPGIPGRTAENDVPLQTAAWLAEGRITAIHLPKERPRRLYFTLPKKTSAFSVTVVPCDVPVEWSLMVRTAEDEPPKQQRTYKKSMPEVWWGNSRKNIKVYSNVGNAVDTYRGPAYAPASIYVVKLQSREHSTKVSVYLQEGAGLPKVFPELPPDPQVRVVGVGMSSVTLRWPSSPSVPKVHQSNTSLQYCVLVNLKHNYRGLCAALEALRRDKKIEEVKRQGATLWPTPKAWKQQLGPHRKDVVFPAPVPDGPPELPCVCQGVENTCTVSELQPDTLYYLDVFLLDSSSGSSAAYTGTSARTHQEARPTGTALRDSKPRWVALAPHGGRLLSFRPRGWPPRALLTMQVCSPHQVRVTASGQTQVLAAEIVAEEPVQIWLQGSPSYLIYLENESPATVAEEAIVKIQASSAYHRQAPVLPPLRTVKSYSKLKTCNSVTVGWHGTEERNLYCVYHQQLDSQGGPTGLEQCLGPESRSDTERAVCKYFQDLNPQEAVSTATIGGLEPGTAYLFDVYMVRRFGIAIKYHSKIVRTKKDC
nr:protein NDNF-like isoform X2 [Paramormyrops kingsleyae]XP_023686813.1 protein NDNF-like isoform X2 [Paramormyrops kingsleyae]XP_023686814.1 protein NDNF-like isoform X2 [Paramormyrops kingsleyae]